MIDCIGCLNTRYVTYNNEKIDCPLCDENVWLEVEVPHDPPREPGETSTK